MPTYNNVNDKIPLVNSTQIIAFAFNTSGNFDATLISNSIIKLTEIAHIEKPLGREFYEELVTEHHANTLYANNTTLLDDYLYRALSYFVKYELMNDIQYNTTSSGIVTNIDEFSQAVDGDSFKRMKEDTYRKANIFLDDMIEYLTDNPTLYPLWQKYGSKETSSDGFSTKKGGIIIY